MNFNEAMTRVEVDLPFPEDLAHFHNERTARLFASTGLEEQLESVPTVVVAGSCGKASTARYLGECVSALFSLTGVDKAVGLGTKPPLKETLDGNRERYQLLQDGEARWIGQEAFTSLVEELPPTQEANLAPYDLRYWLLGRMFVQENVGFGIVEANIGLRHDPANVFPNPVANLITPIGLDHVGLLLPTDAPPHVLSLGERAGPTWHKICAVPAGRSLISGCQDEDVAAVVALHDGPTLIEGRDFRCEILHFGLHGTTARLEIERAPIEVKLRTLGRHQAENACQAAACLWTLWRDGILKGTEAQVRQAIVTGLERTRIPGRMERISENPPVILNAATGVIKIKGMMETLEETLAPDESVWVLMTVAERLVNGDEIPNWLSTSLQRIFASPLTRGFSAIAFDEDVPPSQLAEWARRIAPDASIIAHLEPHAALADAKGRADLVMLVGQSVADFHPDIVSA